MYKKGPKLRGKFDNECVNFIHGCHMVIVLNDYHVHSCWGLHWGSRFLRTGGSWTTHAPLSFSPQNFG